MVVHVARSTGIQHSIGSDPVILCLVAVQIHLNTCLRLDSRIDRVRVFLAHLISKVHLQIEYPSLSQPHIRATKVTASLCSILISTGVGRREGEGEGGQTK